MQLDAQANLITTGAIQLATSGGTPANLNYYETFTGTVTFNSGIVNTTVNLYAMKLGNITIVQHDAVFAAASGTSTTITAAAGSVPARFCPAGTITIAVAGFLTGAGSNLFLECQLAPGGNLTIATLGSGGVGAAGSQGTLYPSCYIFTN